MGSLDKNYSMECGREGKQIVNSNWWKMNDDTTNDRWEVASSRGVLWDSNCEFKKLMKGKPCLLFWTFRWRRSLSKEKYLWRFHKNPERSPNLTFHRRYHLNFETTIKEKMFAFEIRKKDTVDIATAFKNHNVYFRQINIFLKLERGRRTPFRLANKKMMMKTFLI